VKKPNLCIVTEFMRQGSLKDILGTSSVKLTWNQKLRLLRSAALGVNYLHSLQPVIVHRDLKPSNLLVRLSLPAAAVCATRVCGRCVRWCLTTHTHTVCRWTRTGT
jgi:serine/threonine protein kinase